MNVEIRSRFWGFNLIVTFLFSMFIFFCKYSNAQPPVDAVIFPCTGMPQTGTILVTSNGCPSNSSSTLSLIGATTDSNILYQWHIGNSYNPITGATNSTYTTPIPVSTSGITITYYSCSLTCTNSMQTAYTPAAPVYTSIPGGNTLYPINIGNAPCAVAYTNTQLNTLAECFSNSYPGITNQNSPEVYYIFTINRASFVNISTCGSGFNTALHLIDPFGNEIAFNDDNGPLCNGVEASISMYLTNGVYKVISEGSGSNTGNIVTTVSADTLSRNDTMQVIKTCNAPYTWLSNAGGTGNTYTASGVYTHIMANAYCGIDTTVLYLNIMPGPTTLFIKCFIEGYWNGNSLAPVILNQTGAGSLYDCDSITVRLFKSPISCNYMPDYTFRVMLQIDGNAFVNLPNNLSDSFFISIDHRSITETWSANKLLITPCSNTSYDFTTAASQAFGGNQVLLNATVPTFGFFSGDHIKDCVTDMIDLIDLQNSISQSLFGYLAEDYNGDGNIDLLDEPILINNVLNFVTCMYGPCQ